MRQIKITKLIEDHFPHSSIKRWNLYYRNRGRQKSIQTIEQYWGKDLSRSEVRNHVRRMRRAYLFHSWRYYEYCIYNYPRLSRIGRGEFVTESEKNRFCYKVNPHKYRELFKDKSQTYQHFAKYYHRSVIEIRAWERDKDNYYQFVQEHPDYIVKPIDASVGRGVEVLHGDQTMTIQGALKEFPAGVILEELIDQDPLMASAHPQSVNTVRITTFIVDDKVHILHPFTRMGQGGCVVDNAGRGGLICSIDKDSGIVTAVVDKSGHRFVVHPDTGKPIIGFQIPCWDEAVGLAKELARVLPECRYVGWDLALTPQGWVMVEGNAQGQFIGFQLPEQRGVRQELLSIDPNCFS